MILAVACALGCSRDHPLFNTGDAGPDARSGGGPGLSLVPVRADAGPDADPVLEAPCAAACDLYVECGVIVDCNTADAAWLETVCARECPDEAWAAAVTEAPDCRSRMEAAHPDAPETELACGLDLTVCDNYAVHIVECIQAQCPSIRGRGGLRSQFLRACQESTLLGEIDPEEAARVGSTPCDDTALRRAVRAWLDAERSDECAGDGPPIMGGSGLDEELCERACGKETFPNCLPDGAPPVVTDPELCEARCLSDASFAAMYTCLGGTRNCPQMHFCRDNRDDECLRACADVAECAGSEDHCRRIDRRAQAAFFTDCHATCGGRSAFVAALDNAAACAGKIDFIVNASPDFAAACGD